jgi:cyclopropane fatty-acyl-phospholipid synthase-like methyltransferase
MILTSKQEPVLSNDTWSPAKTSMDAARMLRWMVSNPVWGEFDLHDFPSAYQEYYRDWLTNKAVHLDKAREIAQLYSLRRWSPRRHRYCTHEFKIDVIRLLLVRLPVPCELVMHIIGQMWILYQ